MEDNEVYVSLGAFQSVYLRKINKSEAFKKNVKITKLTNLRHFFGFRTLLNT